MYHACMDAQHYGGSWALWPLHAAPIMHASPCKCTQHYIVMRMCTPSLQIHMLACCLINANRPYLQPTSPCACLHHPVCMLIPSRVHAYTIPCACLYHPRCMQALHPSPRAVISLYACHVLGLDHSPTCMDAGSTTFHTARRMWWTV